ncbi:HIT domain-containing protein [Nanoarchaeota archaeon]
MEISDEQKKAMEEQKAQCIFCKIVKGETPSKKVYEDDQILAILDINPATKGHLLVMPKEHYPIMPLIPEETFKHLFSKVKELDKAVQETLLCKETTIFIANGGAAGQQSMHFMLHIIPREGGDDLNMLDISGTEAPESERKEVAEKCAVLQPMLQKNLAMLGFIEGGAPQKMTKEQLLQIIEQNPQLKQVMIQNPDQFKQMIPTNPQIQQLFKDVDVDEIIKIVQSKSGKKGKIDLSDIE